MWTQRRNQPAASHSAEPRFITGPSPRYHRKRPSKQTHDFVRYSIYVEKQRLYSEAFYDMGLGRNPSPGEVVARSDSEILNVHNAEVLRDPKLKYVHPSLRNR